MSILRGSLHANQHKPQAESATAGPVSVRIMRFLADRSGTICSERGVSVDKTYSDSKLRKGKADLR